MRASHFEATYAGNLGVMEVMKFYQVATPEQREELDRLMAAKDLKAAWQLIQTVTNTRLQGDEYAFDDVPESLEEDWKSVLGNLAISTAIGLGGTAGLVGKQAWDNHVNKPVAAATAPVSAAPNATFNRTISAKPQQQTVRPKARPASIEKTSAAPSKSVRPQARPEIKVKPITSNPLELTLKKEAFAAGIRGTELAAFMAQMAHESHDFKSMVEYGGSLDFRKYDPKYSPKKAKQLGNTKVGDGARYKGRGYIQLTGRYNYRMAGKAIGINLEKNPELVEDPKVAAKVAIWYWKTRVQPKVDDFKDVKDVTKQINPAMRGLEDRKDNFNQYLIAMNDSVEYNDYELALMEGGHEVPERTMKKQNAFRTAILETEQQRVIYRLDKDEPMSKTEVLVLGGAGRYTLEGLRKKARREAEQLAQDLQVEHGGAFRNAEHNIKQLTNTINTIVAAYNELKGIRSRGGVNSRGITDEDMQFVGECIAMTEQWREKMDKPLDLMPSGLHIAVAEGNVRQSHPIKVMTNIADAGRAWPVRLPDGDVVTVKPNVATRFLKIIDANSKDSMFNQTLQQIFRNSELFRRAIDNLEKGQPITAK